MENYRATNMKDKLKPGEKAPESGIYGIVGPRGGDTGKEIVAEEREPLPPTRKPGEGYKLKRPAKH